VGARGRSARDDEGRARKPARLRQLRPRQPAEDYGKLLTEPWKFLASSSRTGVIGDYIGIPAAEYFGELPQYLGDIATKTIPGVAVVGPALNYPIPSNAPAVARTGLGLFGAYLSNEKTAQSRRAALQRQGFKGPEIEQILRWEGLVHPWAPAPSP
jgi:hypothetical protein